VTGEAFYVGAEAGYYRSDLVGNTLQNLNANDRRAAPSISESSEDCREQSAEAGEFAILLQCKKPEPLALRFRGGEFATQPSAVRIGTKSQSFDCGQFAFKGAG
jgi:hypothetical protein